MTVETQDAALFLGGLSGLNLLMDDADPATGARIHALGDDFALGDPEAVIAKIESQLQDGDLERIDRFGNREATIPLVIDAPDTDAPGDAIAQMQAALDAACRFSDWTELVYTSPLAGSQPTVFEVTSATVSAKISDLAELQQGCRYVTLSIHARPSVRAQDSVTIDAPAVVGSTTTVVDSGSSTSGWSLQTTAPAPIRNQVTDPQFVSGLSSWAAGAGTESLTNPGGFLRASTASASSAGMIYIQSPPYAVTSGALIEFGVLLHRLDGSALGGSAGAGETGVLYRWYGSTDQQIGADAKLSYILGAGGSTWAETKVIVPSGATSLRLFPYTAKTRYNPTGLWFAQLDIDGPYVTNSMTGVHLGVFSGATDDTAAINYAWTGAVNASPSTATWTAPTLSVVGGAVTGTAFGRSSVRIHRSGSVSMSTLTYMRIKGTATADPAGQVTVADNGLSVTPMSYSYNSTTGVYEVLIKRPQGFSAVDVTFLRTNGAISTTLGVTIAVDQIEITDNPFATGKTQTRQVQIYGSQRTELSLSVLGLDAAGTTPTGLGEQVLVYTASAGDDGRAKFLACRSASNLAGTPDSSAVSGAWTALGTTSAPTSLPFPASTLLTGTYMLMGRVRSSVVGTSNLSFRALVTPSTGDVAYDPRVGWKTAPLTVAASGAAWPSVNTGNGVLVPLGLLRLPPADVEDNGAVVTIQMARGTNAVDLDDLFLLNTDVGQASLLLTGLASGSYSAVRLDAATVDAAQASAWVGVANGTMIADSARWIGEQHAAAPGLLQIATVTPGCATSRVSAHYFPRFHTHVASIEAA